MRFRVLVQPSARRGLDDAFRWIVRRSPGRARLWREGVSQAILLLADFPRCCSVAPENDDFDIEVRQRLYGDYRILLTIEGDVVSILHVRHGARRPVAPDEL